eukprot:m.10694 g.10694  ORF g.10694 m.10694 type:complete len:117 (+) comp22566_c0_seq2:284-634(+)
MSIETVKYKTRISHRKIMDAQSPQHKPPTATRPSMKTMEEKFIGEIEDSLEDPSPTYDLQPTEKGDTESNAMPPNIERKGETSTQTRSLWVWHIFKQLLGKCKTLLHNLLLPSERI